MKKVIGMMFISLVFISCNENINQPQDTSMFEKRTPVVKRDSVRGRVPLERALECLNLTREQRLVIDSIRMEERMCTVECKKEFNDAVKTLREQHRASLEKYRGVQRTREVKKEIEILQFQFRQTQRDLELEHRRKMELCKQNLYTSIEVVLSADQLTLWNLWKATGKIPCGVKP